MSTEVWPTGTSTRLWRLLNWHALNRRTRNCRIGCEKILSTRFRSWLEWAPRTFCLPTSPKPSEPSSGLSLLLEVFGPTGSSSFLIRRTSYWIRNHDECNGLFTTVDGDHARDSTGISPFNFPECDFWLGITSAQPVLESRQPAPGTINLRLVQSRVWRSMELSSCANTNQRIHRFVGDPEVMTRPLLSSEPITPEICLHQSRVDTSTECGDGGIG